MGRNVLDELNLLVAERMALNEQIAKQFHRRGISPEVARLFPSVAGGRDDELARLAADWESLLERESALYREILGEGPTTG
jgi:hypothetical protein